MPNTKKTIKSIRELIGNLKQTELAYEIASGLVLTKEAQQVCLRNSNTLSFISSKIDDLLLEIEAVLDRCDDNAVSPTSISCCLQRSKLLCHEHRKLYERSPF